MLVGAGLNDAAIEEPRRPKALQIMPRRCFPDEIRHNTPNGGPDAETVPA
jgi:hypothetical protein